MGSIQAVVEMARALNKGAAVKPPKPVVIPFEEKHGKAVDKQDRKWVERCGRLRQGKPLIRHLVSLHKPGAKPCICNLSVQEICNLFEWDSPNYNAFYYASAYRYYPKVIRMFPELDHHKYVEMIIGYKDILEIFTFFASTNPKYPAVELQRRLTARFGDGWWATKEVVEFFGLQKSSKNGMLNRWKKCETLKNLVDELTNAELVVEIMTS